MRNRIQNFVRCAHHQILIKKNFWNTRVHQIFGSKRFLHLSTKMIKFHVVCTLTAKIWDCRTDFVEVCETDDIKILHLQQTFLVAYCNGNASAARSNANSSLWHVHTHSHVVWGVGRIFSGKSKNLQRLIVTPTEKRCEILIVHFCEEMQADLTENMGCCCRSSHIL